MASDSGDSNVGPTCHDKLLSRHLLECGSPREEVDV